MWLVNLLGIVPAAVGLCFVALAWQGVLMTARMYAAGRYPVVLFCGTVTVLLLFVAAVAFAIGLMFLMYDWPFPIERYAP